LARKRKQNLVSISIPKSNTDLISCIPRRRTTGRYNHQVRTTRRVLQLFKKILPSLHPIKIALENFEKREREVTKGFGRGNNKKYLDIADIEGISSMRKKRNRL